MKTLVIHPDDRSTDFLKDIYKGRGWTEVTDRDMLNSVLQLTELIKSHDRIIMMGHGTPFGLLFTCVDLRLVYLLCEKECICIWCNADRFVNEHKLKGFHTGMFISEVLEAGWFGITTTQEEIDFSNNLFTELVTKHIDDADIKEILKESYVGESSVIRFNNSRLYDSKKQEVLHIKDGFSFKR